MATIYIVSIDMLVIVKKNDDIMAVSVSDNAVPPSSLDFEALTVH